MELEHLQIHSKSLFEPPWSLGAPGFVVVPFSPSAVVFAGVL